MNEEAMRRVGANMKRARKNKGLTQEELAAIIPGQSKPQISAYENGKRDVPRDKVERFAEVLGISPMSLIPLEEWSRPEEPELNDKEPTVGIGRVLSELLAKKNTNAKALADEIGVNPSTIYSIIKRNSSKVDSGILIKICNALGVSVEYFYKVYEDKEPTMITRLQKIRKEKGISMRKAAMDMGLPYMTYVNWEKGISEPNIAGLIKLADYFGCTIDYLVRGEAPRKMPEAARDHIMRRFCNTEVI